jgi:hypothetical protein
VRRRALLLALLVGGLVAAGGATLGTAAAPGRDVTEGEAALARSDLADVPPPTALSRARDGFGRQLDSRRDVAAAIGIALVLTLAGGWWLARERAARVRHVRPLATRRTRAPPRTATTVHC